MTTTTTAAPSLNPALREFWTAPARNRVLYGGRSSSKTWDAAGFAIFLAQHCKLKFMCARQFQNKIEDSVYTVLKTQIERFGLRDQFVILNNKIVHKYTGTEFVFYGIWRNVAEIKGTEGIDILWIEEAQFLTPDQWREIEPTIRKEHSQVWLVFNPQFATDFVWQHFVVDPPPNTITRQINYDENPFLPESFVRDVIEPLKQDDPEEFAHVYQGQPRANDDQSLIKRSWLSSALDAHRTLNIAPAGSKRIGYDVADDGDKNATTSAYGFLAVETDVWQGHTDDLMPSCSRVYSKARSMQAHVYYDRLGVGAFVGSKFKELNEQHKGRIGYTPFNAGGKVVKPDSRYKHTGVLNQDFFANLKAQAWWSVADRLRTVHVAVTEGRSVKADDIIAIDGTCEHLEQLFFELTLPRKDYDAAGRSKVEGKQSLAKRGFASTDLADSFIMAYSPQSATQFDYGSLL